MKDSTRHAKRATGNENISTEEAERLCACGCEKPCKSTYIRGHNLKKADRRQSKPEPAVYTWDFETDTWVADNPARLNRDSIGSDIFSPTFKVGSRYFHLCGEILESVTSDANFVYGALCSAEGELIPNKSGCVRWHIIKLGRKPAIIYEGRIEVLSTFEAFKITPGRTLTELEHSRMVVIRATNKAGYVRERTIAAMDFEQQRARAKWLDSLDVTASGRVNDIKIFIRTLRDGLGDDGLSIHGQGPIRHKGSRLFVAKSVVFDEKGNYRDDIRVNLDNMLPEEYAYYDVTPMREITEEDIQAGCEELIIAYGECPTVPEVPAAFLGQLYTVPLAGIDPRYFTAIILSGIRGSGKTWYSARYDSVQSQTLRTHLQSIPPVLNLGDTTGTEKGPKYRVKEFSGFAITTDDVLKEGDSPARIIMQSEKVSNLIRSFEGGGAPLGAVDYATHEVVSRQSGALHTSIKVCSELPIIGESTRDRSIILPHISNKWGNDGAFDRVISKRLSTPESREKQHRAWSAYVFWLFPRQDTIMEECLEWAKEETNIWDVEQRFRDRYAPLVAGHYAFGLFCKSHDINAGEVISTAIKALQTCALRQAENTISPALAFRKLARLMLGDERIAFTGPPNVDPDGSESSSWGDPRVKVVTREESGEEIVSFVLPPGINRLSELGLSLSGQTPAPVHGAKVYGYIIPPRQNKGGHAGTMLSRKWIIAFPTAKQTSFCNALTEYAKTRGGATFTIDSLVNSLSRESAGENSAGARAKRRIADSPDDDIRKKIRQERILEVDFEWFFAQDTEEE